MKSYKGLLYKYNIIITCCDFHMYFIYYTIISMKALTVFMLKKINRYDGKKRSAEHLCRIHTLKPTARD